MDSQELKSWRKATRERLVAARLAVGPDDLEFIVCQARTLGTPRGI